MMTITIELAIYILLTITGFCFFAMILIIWRKTNAGQQQNRADFFSDFILHKFSKMDDQQRFAIVKKDFRNFLYQFIELNQSVRLTAQEHQEIIRFLTKYKFDHQISKNLKAIRKSLRIESSIYLGHIGTQHARKSLEIALENEKKYFIKLYIVNALVEIGDAASVPSILSSLILSPDWYQQKVNAIISGLGQVFYDKLIDFLDHPSPQIQRCIIEFAADYASEELRLHLIKHLHQSDTGLTIAAAKSLASQYPSVLANEKYLSSDNILIRNLAVESFRTVFKSGITDLLIPLLADLDTHQTTIETLSWLLSEKPNLIHNFINRFEQTTNQLIRQGLAQVLSIRLDFLILRLLEKDREPVKRLIKHMMLSGINNEIIGFLNRNKNVEIENELLSVVREVIQLNQSTTIEFQTYLDSRVLNKLGLHVYQPVVEKKDEKPEKPKIITLYVLLFIIVGCGPVLYGISNWEAINDLWRNRTVLSISQLNLTIMEHLKNYVINFNYGLVFYATIVNLSYIVLCVFSFIGLKKQIWEWQTKKISYLFKKEILPSISIIAPAFNEEANIIESANSLLNLSYPNYELIVVNDGSKDQTLNTLIDYFQLSKVDLTIHEQIQTKPVLGIYKNPSYPKLVVVNKSNGGKADSLNTGINISSMAYFCGIDADSLLEPDALLKIVTQFLDSDAEGVAVGGNIMPINGCDVDKGMLTKIRLPENHLARFQTIEYLRAFLAGRLGWAYMNCLLIISGAFGLFKKDRIIQIGGYLTSSGKLKKDTVGEDMELVVRLSRLMKELKIKYKINYSFNANCWTEVPENLKVLSGQRDRWHRGLIDILFFHRKILFNPKYGSMGMFSMPYFLIFEVLGPLIEIQGYLMIIMAIYLGLMNPQLAILLFISTILMGIFVSLFSLIIAEKENQIFTLKEIFLMIGYAIIENFGFRQYVSFWRVTGYLSAMKKPKGWGTMVRKGFGDKQKQSA